MRRILASIFFLVPGISPALSDGVHFKLNWQENVDCERPVFVRNFPVSGRGSAVLLPDGSGSIDVILHAVFDNEIRFDGRLGQRTEVPGGTAEVHVSGHRSLRATWHLPNNDVVFSITADRRGCDLKIAHVLHRGQTLYSLHDGGTFSYCSAARITQTSCEAS